MRGQEGESRQGGPGRWPGRPEPFGRVLLEGKSHQVPGELARKVRISPSLGHRLPQRTVSQGLKLRKAGDLIVPSYTFCRYLHEGYKNYKFLRYEVLWELFIPVS